MVGDSHAMILTLLKLARLQLKAIQTDVRGGGCCACCVSQRTQAAGECRRPLVSTASAIIVVN